MEEIKERIKGTVEHITYKNEQNGYTVATVRANGKRVVVVGNIPFLNEGDNGVFTGSYTVHSSYGQQFKAQTFERTAPEGTAGILRYLSSGAIKGVGPSTAARIVERFGGDTLDIIQNKPQELANIRGISLQKALGICEEYNRQFGVREIMLLLGAYNVTVETSVKIYRILGSDAAQRVKENPYILCDERIGFPFEKAEQMAADFEISPDNEARLFAGVEYILRKNLLNGHTCLPKDKLVAVATRLLESDQNRIESICDRLVSQFRISEIEIYDKPFLALPEFLAAEEYIAARLLGVKNHIGGNFTVDELEIDYVENKLGKRFEKLQRKAIKEAFENGILILTGGPGTGKTTTLNAIITLFEKRGAALALAAPTGRAAKRMTELTGREATTIHRLLEVEWGENETQEFARNERNPLDCEVLIVDEASMIDSLLFYNLLKALRLSCRIILVGDTDQLPSVSAGNVLGDLLASGKFPSTRLKNVFRQAGESTIISNAHAIINKTDIDLSNGNDDFFMMRKGSPQEVCDTVLSLCTERLPTAYGFNPLTDIQVICPSRKTDTGTVSLNMKLQAALNQDSFDGQAFNYKGMRIGKGDKVMQIKNNYDIVWEKDNGETGTGVFNGDVGFVIEVNRKADELKVRFDERTVTYYGEQIGELELAYAITAHKSQGSEFDCVILPLFDVPSQLRYRNLLYTAITRAKKLLVIVGQEKIFLDMAANDRKMLRYTMLEYLLND